MTTDMNTASGREPSEIELLLPWYAAGTLDPRETQQVETALANDPELARRYEWVRAEFAQETYINEAAGEPSGRDVKTLFAKIDALPAQPAVRIDQHRSISATASPSFLPRFRRARWPGRRWRRRSPSCCRRACLPASRSRRGIRAAMKRPRRRQTLPATAPMCSFASSRRPAPPISPTFLDDEQTEHCWRAVRRPALPGARRVNQACQGGPDAHRQDAAGRQGRRLHRRDRVIVKQRLDEHCGRVGSLVAALDAAPHREFAMRKSSMSPRPILALLLGGLLSPRAVSADRNSAAAFGMFGFGAGRFRQAGLRWATLAATPPPRLGGGRIAGRPPGGSGRRAAPLSVAARRAIMGSAAASSVAVSRRRRPAGREVERQQWSRRERRHKAISLSFPTKSLPRLRRTQRRKRSIGFARRYNLTQLETQSFPLIGDEPVSVAHRRRPHGGERGPRARRRKHRRQRAAELRFHAAGPGLPRSPPARRAMRLNTFWLNCKSSKRSKWQRERLFWLP